MTIYFRFDHVQNINYSMSQRELFIIWTGDIAAATALAKIIAYKREKEDRERGRQTEFSELFTLFISFLASFLCLPY